VFPPRADANPHTGKRHSCGIYTPGGAGVHQLTPPNEEHRGSSEDIDYVNTHTCRVVSGRYVTERCASGSHPTSHFCLKPDGAQTEEAESLVGGTIDANTRRGNKCRSHPRVSDWNGERQLQHAIIMVRLN
ncbi:unnamed protein product, partial [Ectocarpus fasciculatus]